jgi:hypothetical protein
MEPMPVRTQVLVEEDGFLYIALGNTSPPIAQRLGWTQANVWLPEHALLAILRKRGWVILDPVAAATEVLAHPIIVRRDQRPDDAVCFIAEPSNLRQLGLLRSETTRYVDALVELRKVPGGNLLRLFHLSPRDNDEGGEQLWP